MSKRAFRVELDVAAKDGSSRRPVRFTVLAETEAEARGKAAKMAKRVGESLSRGGFSVRGAAADRGGDWT